MNVDTVCPPADPVESGPRGQRPLSIGVAMVDTWKIGPACSPMDL